MIRSSQLKLLDRAREALGHDASAFADLMQRWGGADSAETLSAAGFERFMDYCTVCGFRDRRRPVLSKLTLKAFELAWFEAGFTQNQLVTYFHSSGVHDLRYLDGQKLLHEMVNLEKSGFRLDRFEYFREPKVTAPQLKLYSAQGVKSISPTIGTIRCCRYSVRPTPHQISIDAASI